MIILGLRNAKRNAIGGFCRKVLPEEEPKAQREGKRGREGEPAAMSERLNDDSLPPPEFPPASDTLPAVYRKVVEDMAADGFRGIRLDEVADTHRELQASRPVTSVIGRSITRSLRRHLAEEAGPQEMP